VTGDRSKETEEVGNPGRVGGEGELNSREIHWLHAIDGSSPFKDEKGRYWVQGGRRVRKSVQS